MLMMAALLGGCGDSNRSVETGNPDEVSYAPALEIQLPEMERSATGLYRRDLVVGTGEEATPGRIATVHYTGWLPNGEQFDSSRGGEPFQFGVGMGGVIAGWDEGVVGMRTGGRRQLVIPPALAYGERGAGGVIPPNATLVFEVELLDLE